MEYKTNQIVFIFATSGSYEIKGVTEKAILLSSDDGKHTGNGTIDCWIPISIIEYKFFNDSRDNSQHGIHNIDLPMWFIMKNSKKL